MRRRSRSSRSSAPGASIKGKSSEIRARVASSDGASDGSVVGRDCCIRNLLDVSREECLQIVRAKRISSLLLSWGRPARCPRRFPSLPRRLRGPRPRNRPGFSVAGRRRRGANARSFQMRGQFLSARRAAGMPAFCQVSTMAQSSGETSRCAPRFFQKYSSISVK